MQMSIAMNENELLKKIEEVFPFVEMPSGNELVFHDSNCICCNHLRKELEVSKKITGDVIRSIHQDLYHLSAKSWNWILPYYIRYCLTAEAKHNQMETAFLIYNFSPALEFQADTLKKLSMLNNTQIMCLIYFLEWCLTFPHWKEFYIEDIKDAINFLRTMPKRN